MSDILRVILRIAAVMRLAATTPRRRRRQHHGDRFVTLWTTSGRPFAARFVRACVKAIACHREAGNSRRNALATGTLPSRLRSSLSIARRSMSRAPQQQ